MEDMLQKEKKRTTLWAVSPFVVFYYPKPCKTYFVQGGFWMYGIFYLWVNWNLFGGSFPVKIFDQRGLEVDTLVPVSLLQWFFGRFRAIHNFSIPDRILKFAFKKKSIIERIIREIMKSSPIPILYNHLTIPNQKFALEAPLSKHRNAGGSKTYIVLRRYSPNLFRHVADKVFSKNKYNVFQDFVILVSGEENNEYFKTN